MAGVKESAIRKRAKIIEIADEESIFEDPIEDVFYTDEELRYLLSTFQMDRDLSGMAPVTKSHAVKKKFVEHLGYPKPSKLRGKNRKSKPKFRGQLFDLFAQKSTNLQVWNYVPYEEERVKDLPEPFERWTFSDCRYILIPVVEGQVGKPRLLKGRQLKELDSTGTQTLKRQATIPEEKFSDSGVDVVNPLDGEERAFVEGRLNPQEAAQKFGELVGRNLPDGTDRQIGQAFHREVAELLGLSGESVDDGQFPDIPARSVEAKFQMSPTIDLGKVLPSSRDEVRPGIRPANVTYVVGVGDITDTPPTVNHVVAVLGRDFEERFRVWPTEDKKIQIPIPDEWIALR